MNVFTHRLPSVALQRYAWGMAFYVFWLVVAGGMVTSTGSGLAVPDWPLSFGQFFPKMEGGVFYEHGHRMIAGIAAVGTVILAIWLWKAQDNRTLRQLGWAAVGVVILQALLGGLTVLLKLPPPVSIAHACLGQIYFCLIVSIAVLSREGYREDEEPFVSDSTRKIQRLTLLLIGFIFLQLVAGAAIRHSAWRGALHLHLFGAFLVALHAGLLGVRVLSEPEMPADLRSPTITILALVGLQVIMGFCAWQLPVVWVRTAHVGNGALVLATAVILAIQARRRLVPSLKIKP